MAALTSWSYSSLNTFENCPRWYQMVKVDKVVVDEGSAQTREGTETHEALEMRVRDGVPLPQKLAKYEGMAAEFAKFDGDIHTEIPLAINRAFEPVDFSEADAWCRAIGDILLIKDKWGFAGDYKTGKIRDTKQLMLMAGIVFKNFPQVKTIKTSFIWLKHEKTTDATYKREDEGLIWDHFKPKIMRLERAYDEDHWIARPSGLCSWCPCTKAHCEFAKK